MKETVRGLMGEFYLNLGNLDEAEAAFRCVSDVGGLRALERIYLGNGEFLKALSCRQAAGEDWTPEQRAELGHRLLLQGKLRGAEEAFTAAKDVPGLMELGRKFLTGGQLGEAMRVFNRAGAREDLQAVGRTYLEQDQLVDAHRAFQLAADREGLRTVAEAYLFKGRLDSAKCLARRIDHTITEEQLIEAAWHCYRQQSFSSAGELFLEAHCVRGLKAVAQQLLGQGAIEAATRIAEEIVRISDAH